MNVLLKILLVLVIITTVFVCIDQGLPLISRIGDRNDVGVNNEVKIPEADIYISASVTPDDQGKVPAGGVNINNEAASVIVPEGVQMEDGATELALTITGIDEGQADLVLSDVEVSTALDVHITGVAENNLVPMEVKLLAVAMKGLNSTSVRLYHVENGETIEMTLVANDAEFTQHNQFKYDPASGDITLYIASFSEFAVVLNTENKWEGGVDHNWYNADATELVISNAEQLWSFSQIVGGMAKDSEGNVIAQDSFESKTVKLIADINLGDKESENNESIIFYPIGYNSDDGLFEKTGVAVSTGFYSFMGTFDGNGHTISNIYQNTWEMKGDHNWYSPEEQYYRDGMGLFGKVYNGTVKNLTVKNFSSDGEIATTGVIAAYADGATFENISIFNCNPRVYNIGNGGIVGCAGWYAKEADMKTTFTNITVDNSNKISALWGSYDVACGGIIGQYYPTSGQSSYDYPVNGGVHFENCHVSAVMDVYNDVCANYQYYAYRYTGMLIGSIRENVTGEDGHVYPRMDGITASGCTVHFGDWNDYYYCELVANTTASYTHDHQMSRLTQVTSVDVVNMKVTDLDGNTTDISTSGRVNYVVVKAKDANGMWIHGDGHDYAECYHFVDGTVWTHDMAGSHDGTDDGKVIDKNGDGTPDLKEDKQLVYREFNQLFTGYGWGVTSKGLTDFDGVTNMDITQGDHETSVEKFEGKVTQLVINKQYRLSDIFALIENAGVELVPDALTITVTNLDENGNVSAVFVRDENNWENGTLTLRGTGRVRITIQDYYFCVPTSIDVDVEAVGVTVGGNVISDTYVDSSKKDTDYSAKDTLNTYSSSFRSYFRVSVSDILENKLFNPDNAKVQLILTVTDGSVAESTTFTLKAYTPSTDITNVDFSKITWNSVSTTEGSVGDYSQLHWNNGTALATVDYSTVVDGKITITLDYSDIIKYVDENGNILFAFGSNTSGLKVGSLENTTENTRPVFNVVLSYAYGKIVDDTYVDSGNKEKDYTDKTELNIYTKETEKDDGSTTTITYYRSYFRFNLSDVLAAEGFEASKANAKVTFTFTVTSGTIADDTTFTFYAFNVDEATDGVAFSNINWSSVASGAQYEQLGFNNGYTVSLVGKKTMSEADNIAYADGIITITVNYSDIEACMDANGNCIFGLTTGSSDLKVGSMENEGNIPTVFVTYTK